MAFRQRVRTGEDTEPIRERISADISPELRQELFRLSNLESSSSAEILRRALKAYVDSRLPERAVREARPSKVEPIRSRAQVVFYSNIIIDALQEALDYDPLRHHNRPPPLLRIEDGAYLQEIQSLIAELRRLNDLLEAGLPSKEAKAVVLGLKDHFHEFFQSYASALGKGAAGLTIGAAAALLYQAGVGHDAIKDMLEAWKLAG